MPPNVTAPITTRTGMFRGNAVNSATVVDVQGLLTSTATALAGLGSQVELAGQLADHVDEVRAAFADTAASATTDLNAAAYAANALLAATAQGAQGAAAASAASAQTASTAASTAQTAASRAAQSATDAAQAAATALQNAGSGTGGGGPNVMFDSNDFAVANGIVKINAIGVRDLPTAAERNLTATQIAAGKVALNVSTEVGDVKVSPAELIGGVSLEGSDKVSAYADGDYLLILRGSKLVLVPYTAPAASTTPSTSTGSSSGSTGSSGTTTPATGSSGSGTTPSTGSSYPALTMTGAKFADRGDGSNKQMLVAGSGSASVTLPAGFVAKMQVRMAAKEDYSALPMLKFTEADGQWVAAEFFGATVAAEANAGGYQGRDDNGSNYADGGIYEVALAVEGGYLHTYVDGVRSGERYLVNGFRQFGPCTMDVAAGPLGQGVFNLRIYAGSMAALGALQAAYPLDESGASS